MLGTGSGSTRVWTASSSLVVYSFSSSAPPDCLAPLLRLNNSQMNTSLELLRYRLPASSQMVFTPRGEHPNSGLRAEREDSISYDGKGLERELAIERQPQAKLGRVSSY